MSVSPFVYWAQTEDTISLKIDLKDVKDFDLDTNETQLSFSATGKGAHGTTVYKFNLEFLNKISKENVKAVKTDGKIDVYLLKAKKGFWTRLISTPSQKPGWLKVDFEKWKSEDPDSDEDMKPRDIMKDYPNMYDQLQKEELGFRKENFKKVYLVLYNLFQFVGFTYILVVMGVRYSRDGQDSMQGTYHAVGNALKFVQLIQYLEVMHPIFRYTKGSALVPFLQVTGRNFVLFIMIEKEPRMVTKPVIFYLFIIWSMIEIVRYPYYLTQLLNFQIGILTWLRYTLWIPLYPLGVLCEGIIILRNIPYFYETERFIVKMPNKWNFAFHMPTFLYVYLVLMLLPGSYFMCKHMQQTRSKKLGGRKKYN